LNWAIANYPIGTYTSQQYVACCTTQTLAGPCCSGSGKIAEGLFECTRLATFSVGIEVVGNSNIQWLIGGPNEHGESTGTIYASVNTAPAPPGTAWVVVVKVSGTGTCDWRFTVYAPEIPARYKVD
jgi:hypothetical protein